MFPSGRFSTWKLAKGPHQLADTWSYIVHRQVDEEPPIRANTTILLGNLATHLGEATQKRVLLNAFTRSLKDGFPPARVAGLKLRFAKVARARCAAGHGVVNQQTSEPAAKLQPGTDVHVPFCP
jgi:hypothetical protein